MHKDKDKEKQAAEKPEEEKKEPSELDKALEENGLLKQELENWKNKYYTVYADMANLRKTLEKDHLDAMKYRAEGFLEELIPALDSFKFALEANPNGDEAKNYKIGFSYIYNQITSALANEGVSLIEPKVGDHFDATYMQAVEAVESELPEGAIVKVLTKGYKLKDRLVKPVMVTVSAAKAKDKQDEEAKEA